MPIADRPPNPDGSRSGGELVVDTLVAHGVTAVFLVPGESFLPILDALWERDEIRRIVCRHESAAANAASAHAKMTGTPGVCLVTRGPGTTQASVGLHTALQDSIPLVMLIGQIPTAHRDREAFQEIDYRGFLAPLTKWTAEVDRAERLPEYVARACHTAQVGRPGPVALALPEDVLSTQVDGARVSVQPVQQAAPTDADMQSVQAALDQAERPLLLLGGSGWTSEGVADIEQFSEAFDLPVAATFRRQDLADHDHPNYVGDVGLGINPSLQARIRDSDLLLAVGPRLGEATTGGYTTPDPGDTAARLIHVHPGAEELGSVYPAQRGIQAGPVAFARAAAALRPGREGSWSAWRADARDDYLAWSTPPEPVGPLDLAHVMVQLRDRLPDAIITNGAGNYTAWAHRFLRFHSYPSQLAPTSGAMGYGIPAALAAALEAPDRPIIALAGDGCFAMAASELATLHQYHLRVIVIVVNNGMYGTIRMHQERSYPGRPIGTDLVNPDFARLARSYGLSGETIEQLADFLPALERALAVGTSALIELRTDPAVLTPAG